MGFGGTRNNDYRDILRQLVGPEGEPGHGWELGSGVPMCEWEGIVCNQQKELIEINLVGKDLSDGGYLPKELGHIQTLEAIRLNATDISGTIPISIAHLPKLKVFSVGDNQLTGVLPPFFVSPTLQTFNVSENDLVGTISQTFYYATDGHAALQYFDVDSNHLSGTINEAIGMWHQLNTLSMSDNNFSGTIPKTLGVLATKGQLTYLYLDSNNFVGTIPEELAITSQDDADKNKLEDVWLHENLLSGTIPADFALLTKLKDFYIDGNKLTGIIPPDLCDNTQGINEDFLDLVLDKELKNHESSSSSGAASSALPVRPENSCDILSCPVNTYSSEGVFPCKPCPTDEIMPWLGGEERCYHQDTLKILKLFYESTNGQHWNIEQNNWFQSDDYCHFEGVRCNNDKHVQELILPNIGLRGQLPPDLGMLEHLHTLDVSDNDLTGGLPAELRLASSLKWLDVSGNQIRGPVPPLLCKVDGLNGNGSGGKDLSSSSSANDANDVIGGLLYKCSYIACPPGTASVLGRESLDGKTECLPCRNDDDENFMNVIGLKDCSHYKPPPWVHLQSKEESMYEEYHNARIFGIALICIAMIVLVLMFFNEVCKWYFSSDTTQQPKHTPLPMNGNSSTNDNEYDIDDDNNDENYRGSTRTTTRGTRNSGMSSAVMT